MCTIVENETLIWLLFHTDFNIQKIVDITMIKDINIS
jgi:hypothetical protein